MIAKNEWFTQRKYTGWGLSPKTWQGWVYIATAIMVGVLLGQLPISINLRTIALAVYVIFILVDILSVLSGKKLDEREAKIEAIAERNASWSMVAAVAIAVMYISFGQKSLQWQEILSLLIAILFTGLIAKGLSNFILKDREL